MYKISFKYDLSKVDEGIEKLNIEEIYNVFYTPPFEVITTDYGYEYEEISNNEKIDVNVVIEEDDDDELLRVTEIIKRVLGFTDDELNVERIENNFEYNFEGIDLGNGWILCDPSYETDLRRINFVPQGAFGTGEHETTQVCLRWILDKNLNGKKVIDIGTGSGVLSIAAGIKGAESITALDIRDIKEEVDFNASLNGVSNINVIVGNVLEDNTLIDDTFDLTIINIGGEETEMFMEFIDKVTNKDGELIVSGLFIRSFEKVIEIVEKFGFILTKGIKGEEWCTAVFKR
ncbi:50S ribosomal protein L11 methyltransferase [Clostridium cylindrosporum]|uniref:Ribosomal protein L11 methyltransferase PrmA n=1 Tax=Clostridium cylindrosporum DSM 605 TaxID=1121307 RepID=A0A0J8DD60_CLOCY|nr:50S ribosomal protein L11 methyltransferase [Clostridium cylindrosporum]KMT22184.1 ribosomal protein L11 methyltransferase PrmA [Clostridium cylindrosporum DSM 605]